MRGYLKRELSDPTSPLIVTGERVIGAELPPLSSARAVLAAVGAGETEFTKVLHRSGIGRTSLSVALKTLTEKRIVNRQAPFGSTSDAKLSRYTVTDPYLRFWLRFIAPSLPVIERRRGDLVCERVMDSWSTFRGHAIEPIVRANIERMLPDTRFADARFISSYWTRTNHPEVDLIGADRDRARRAPSSSARSSGATAPRSPVRTPRARRRAPTSTPHAREHPTRRRLPHRVRPPRPTRRQARPQRAAGRLAKLIDLVGQEHSVRENRRQELIDLHQRCSPC